MKQLLAAILMLLLASGEMLADDWGPWEMPAQSKKPQVANQGPLQLAVKFFQSHLSPVDGPRCPMYPTCSAYALQALRKHGPLFGTFQTVDRLYREGDVEHEHTQPINKWGYVRFHDPLQNNDFWLR
ncbi:membrane protein insertion efficiency factor YidD [Malonomonas rubra]|uniref:membrane protein insertion efficiency factor YidD n=1 Tax=Malonomonas rubra TaxID=57040 RepID=UPI0026EAD8DF|nr:membrane protein insertion efficiency factor YidD [Malonomonas rubra]